MLIFEETQSPLYYSNDRRVYVEKQTHPDDAAIALPRTVWVVKKVAAAERGNDEIVFATYDRVKADAYIAGYDLGLEKGEENGRKNLAEALNAWGQQLAEGDDPTGHRITL